MKLDEVIEDFKRKVLEAEFQDDMEQAEKYRQLLNWLQELKGLRQYRLKVLFCKNRR